jgi:folate-binding protein YgfZ
MHEQAEASFLPYGPDIAIVESYGEVESEYAAIRKGATLMDAPHRSVLILTGKDRLTFLNNKLTNDTAKLSAGQGVYAFLLNLKGRIVQDLNVLQTEDATILEMDTRVVAALAAQFEKYLFTEDVKILTTESAQLGRLTLIGPKAADLLKKVCDAGVDTLNLPLQSAKRSIAKVTVTIFRNDPCGEPGYELIVPRDQLVTLWQVLHEAGHDETSDIHLRAIGWSAFNTARIEAGTPLCGIDINDTHLPMETGPAYARAVNLAKGCYLGQEIVARMHSRDAVAKMLIGLKVAETKLPIADKIGIITSSCTSPMLGNTPIAMGYVKRAFTQTGRVVQVYAEGTRVKATVTDLPFWKKQ